MFRLYTEAGKDGYPPEWHQEIKHAVREQAGHRCVRCKHPYKCGDHPMRRNADGKLESWTPCDRQCAHDGPLRLLHRGEVLTTLPQLSGGMVAGDIGPMYGPGYAVEALARILTVHHLDEVKLNCCWWNLCALCQRCHLSVQGRVKMQRAYMFEHSPWFRPYVAGYLAFRKLGLDLTREETIARMEELLTLAP